MQYAVIMAGGAGTRLWPAARRRSPKQLQRLIFEQPLIAETVERLAHVYAPERIFIVTASRYADPIKEILPNVPPQNIISEPVGRNTAAAIALAAFQIARDDPDGVFAVFPADHVILKPQELYRALDFANALALEHRVVDIGVPPSHPETGYGYVKLGREIDRRDGLPAYEVEGFVEKPDRATAESYVSAGNYIWNSGMFVWRAGEYLSALQEHLPDTYARLEGPFHSGNWDELTEAYARIENISVDYAIMERTSDVVALSVDFGWRDIGDWAALYDLMEHDAHGNAFDGRHAYIDSERCLMLAPKKLVAAIGVRDLVVVDTDDVLLIMPRERSQDVKALLEEIKERDESDYL
jgi:mannose-1-phosphate guanylyltransferase